MDIKKLSKASKIVEKIKCLDTEITEIDKFAILVANGETKSSFELKCEDIGKKKENEERVEFDSDGSLIYKSHTELSSFMNFSLANYGFFSPKQPDSKHDNEIILKNELSVNSVMAILGVLLCEKQSLRQHLITKLQEIGIELN